MYKGKKLENLSKSIIGNSIPAQENIFSIQNPPENKKTTRAIGMTQKFNRKYDVDVDTLQKTKKELEDLKTMLNEEESFTNGDENKTTKR